MRTHTYVCTHTHTRTRTHTHTHTHVHTHVHTHKHTHAHAYTHTHTHTHTHYTGVHTCSTTTHTHQWTLHRTEHQVNQRCVSRCLQDSLLCEMHLQPQRAKLLPTNRILSSYYTQLPIHIHRNELTVLIMCIGTYIRMHVLLLQKIRK